MLYDLICEDFYVLDTETTGLGEDAQIVELGLIDRTGKKIIDTLVKPTIQIPQDAVDIHGITTEKALDEGIDFSQLNEMIFDVCTSDDPVSWVIYNANYDVRLYEQSCFLHDLNTVFDVGLSPFVHCAMLEYSEFYGEKNSRGFKWQSLVNACKQQNVKVENAHRAIADCQMTLSLIKAVWNK